jgi:hypothetical protein
MSIVSATLTTALADFAVKLAIKLGWKFNDGPFHRHAEKRRRAMIARELKQKDLDYEK